MRTRKIPGLAAAVVDAEGVLLAEGFGLADRERELAADARTLFPIASVTKTFTGIAVMQLVEQGRLELDVPIARYIPELALPGGEERAITPRMLLSHHSGIQGDIMHGWILSEPEPRSYNAIVELANDVGTVFRPGTMHSYSNAGYALLGVLIERASGLSYAEYLRQNIFRPLGLEDSVVHPGEATERVLATGYTGDGSTSPPMIRDIPAGALALSARDAAAYLRGVLEAYRGQEAGTGALLRRASMREMMSVQNADVPMDRGFSIGLTWFLQDPIGVDTLVAAHGGDIAPYESVLITMPELGIGVFVACNGSGKGQMTAVEMGSDIAAALYEYHTGTEPNPSSPGKRASLGRRQAEALEGTYATFMGPLGVRAKRTSLRLDFAPVPVAMIPHRDGVFSLQARLFGFLPIPVRALRSLTADFREYDNESYLYVQAGGVMQFPGKRIEPFAMPEQFASYEGRYTIVNMDDSDYIRDVTVRRDEEEGFTYLEYSWLGNSMRFALRPTGERSARTAGIGRGMGESVRWKRSERGLRMYWSGLELERIE
jgi:CubicO group peptidase (beta-lactamase class C family)